MSLTTRLAVTLTAMQYAAKDLGTARFPVSYDKAMQLASGTAAGQADLLFSDTRTIVASGTDPLDLAGSLTDALGTTLSFARIKGLIVAAAAGNVNDVVIGGAASNGFVSWVGDPTDKIKVKPGGLLVLMSPGATSYPVTAATADQLLIANSGGTTSVTYDVVIIGASA
jgi:hypothetical protein